MSTRKDYKNRSRGAHGSGAASGLMWLGTGLAIGLFVAFLVYLSVEQNKPAARAVQPSAPLEVADSAKLEQRAVNKTTKPSSAARYDFYAILPEKKIEIPPTDLASERDNGQRRTPKGPWMLQAGSFRNYGDADRLRANLAFKGLESKIDLSTNDAGTWHRVRLGPFQSRREADRIKSKLARSNIDSIILQVRR